MAPAGFLHKCRPAGQRPFLLFLLLLGASAARAQGLPSESLRWGTWRLGVQTGLGVGNNHVTGASPYWSTGLQVGWTFTPERFPAQGRGNWEYAMEFIPLFLVRQGNTVRGFGVNPVLFRRTFTHGKRLAPYFESSLGLLFFHSDVPPGDTATQNICVQAGGGIYVFTRRKRAASFAFKFVHISNGGLGNRNPEIDGIHFTVGYQWFY